MRGAALGRPSHQRVPAPHVMTASGTWSVAAPPSGPVHRVVAACRMVAGFSCQQTTGFGWCEVHEVGCVGLDIPFSRSCTAITARNAWASMASVTCWYQPHVAADLVLVQATFVLRALEALLDLPAASGDADQASDGGLQRSAGKVVGNLIRLADAAAGQHPPLPGRLVAVELGHGGQTGAGPVVEPLARGPRPRRQTLPRLGQGLVMRWLIRGPWTGCDLGTATT